MDVIDIVITDEQTKYKRHLDNIEIQMLVENYKLVNEVYRDIIKEPLFSNKCMNHVLDGSTNAKDIYST